MWPSATAPFCWTSAWRAWPSAPAAYTWTALWAGLATPGEIVRRLNAGGRLIGLDRDETALEAARRRLAPYIDRVTLVHSNFSCVAQVLDDLNVPAVDGMLFDLGVSSPQLDDAQRGSPICTTPPWTCAWTAPPA